MFAQHTTSYALLTGANLHLAARLLLHLFSPLFHAVFCFICTFHVFLSFFSLAINFNNPFFVVVSFYPSSRSNCPLDACFWMHGACLRIYISFLVSHSILYPLMPLCIQSDVSCSVCDFLKSGFNRLP